MIIGNGLIANLFRDYDQEDIIFFASGVSNSSETDVNQFLREENLVRDTFTKYPQQLFIYFSTCSIYDSSKTNSLYVLHKLRMEELIKTHCENYLILRVSNAVGKGGSPNLLLNYIVRSVKSGEQINVHTKATRNLIDTDDIKRISIALIQSKDYNKIVNLAYPFNFGIIEILEIMERYFGTNLDLNLIKSGESYNIAISETESYFLDHQLMDKENYLCNILEKYYS